MTGQRRFWQSSIGGKVIMAVTGVLLFLFLVGHLLGNLQLLGGREAINRYALFLHERPVLVWGARLGLLAVFVLHVVMGIRLSRQNRAARPVAYAQEDTVAATWASRSMLLTGLTTGAFLVYHLLHFTLGVVHADFYALKQQAPDHMDVYAMMVGSFGNPAIVAAYVAFMVLLFFHLAHGLQSFAQTLGLYGNRPWVRRLAAGLAALIAGGNVFLSLSVLVRIVPPLP